MSEKKLIVLFDEHGVPTFKDTNKGNVFLGVAVLYKFLNEERIFNDLDGPMGLSELHSRKNHLIDKSNALNIAKNFSQQEAYIAVNCIDTNNKILSKITEQYIKWGNIERKRHRKVGERKSAHFLHKSLVDFCISDVIDNYLAESTQKINRFEIWADNWNYPKSDVDIMLEDAMEILQLKTQKILDKYSSNKQVLFEPVRLLISTDDKRKRFIDALTSIVSRAFLKTNNPKFDLNPIKQLERGFGDKFLVDNITDKLIDFITYFMDKYAPTLPRD